MPLRVIQTSGTARRAPRALLCAVAALLSASSAHRAGAQEAPVRPAPPLAGFTAMRVAVFPVQLWRADTSQWSRAVDWAATRTALDSSITEVLRERGMGRRWAYSSDVVRSARRNPTYTTDPYALGVARWRNAPPKGGDALPPIVADNMRPFTALGDARYALIPVELRADGAHVILRLVMADTRGRRVVWAGDLLAPGGDGLVETLATLVANLVIEP